MHWELNHCFAVLKGYFGDEPSYRESAESSNKLVVGDFPLLKVEYHAIIGCYLHSEQVLTYVGYFEG